MAYKISQGAGPRRIIGLIIAIVLHIGFFVGLQLGLVQKAVELVETQVQNVAEPPPPPPETPPPPPPPVVETPPPFVPPPTIDIATPTTSTTAIQQVTNVAPPPDRNPVGRNVTKPDYPESSKEGCEEGSVSLVLSIDEKGNVTNVRLAKSSGYPALDNSALRAAKSWKYSPARQGGKPVAYEWPVVVKFQLRDELTKRAYDECRKMREGR